MSKNISNKVILSFRDEIRNATESARDNNFFIDKDSNFIRDSKVGLLKTLNILFSLKPNGLKYELKKCSTKDFSLTPSALVQSRSKIKPELFEGLLKSFNSRYKCTNKFKGYSLLTIDGSDINIPFDKKDSLTFHGGKPHKDGTLGVGYNKFHLNGLYDCLNNRFIDAIIQGSSEANEQGAMLEMCERYSGDPAIFIADRGYESINLFEHLEKIKNHKYLIRVKDIESTFSLFKKIKFNSDEFDEDVKFIITNLNKSIYHKNPNYKVIQKNQKFDYLDDDNHFYEVKWRVVRFKVEDTYEMVVTNLDRYEFTPEDLKYIYNKRWEIETAYRYLKEELHLEKFLSRKREHLKQEIWIKLIVYNVSTIITLLLEKRKDDKKNKKHEYKINLTLAIRNIFEATIKALKKGAPPPNLDKAILSELSPVRKDRKFPRVKRLAK